MNVPLRYFKPLGMDGVSVAVLQLKPNFPTINSGGRSGDLDVPPLASILSAPIHPHPSLAFSNCIYHRAFLLLPLPLPIPHYPDPPRIILISGNARTYTPAAGLTLPFINQSMTRIIPVTPFDGYLRCGTGPLATRLGYAFIHWILLPCICIRHSLAPIYHPAFLFLLSSTSDCAI